MVSGMAVKRLAGGKRGGKQALCTPSYLFYHENQ